MPIKGVTLIIIIAAVCGVGFYEQIYNAIKNFFKNKE